MAQAKQKDFRGHDIYRWYVFTKEKRFVKWAESAEAARVDAELVGVVVTDVRPAEPLSEVDAMEFVTCYRHNVPMMHAAATPCSLCKRKQRTRGQMGTPAGESLVGK